MNVLTFDLEEWFTYGRFMDDNKYERRLEYYLDSILDLLMEKRINTTFFVLGTIARSHPKIIKKIANHGHEIGCHSDIHNWLTKYGEKGFKEDTSRAIFSIESTIGNKVLGYRAPAFSITENNKWVFEVLKEFGIEYDCSIFPAKRDFGGYPSFYIDEPSIISYNGIFIKEFPIGVTNMFGKKIAYSGGGYFRLLPYSIIKTIMNSRNYNMTYFHIKDFDKEQIKDFNLRYFKNYYGINSTMMKFKQLISEFELKSVAETNSIIDWSIVSKIEI